MDESDDEETLEYEIEVVESSASSYTGAFESDDSEHSSCSLVTSPQLQQDQQQQATDNELDDNNNKSKILVNNLAATTLCSESSKENEGNEQVDAARFSADSAQEEDELDTEGDSKETMIIPVSFPETLTHLPDENSQDTQEEVRDDQSDSSQQLDENEVAIVIDYSSDISTPHELHDLSRSVFFALGGPTKQPVELVLSSVEDQLVKNEDKQDDNQKEEDEQLVEIFVSDYEPVKIESLLVREMGPVVQFASLHNNSNNNNAKLVPCVADTEILKHISSSREKRQTEISLELEQSIHNIHSFEQQRVCICDNGELLNLTHGHTQETDIELYAAKGIKDFEDDLARAEREAEAEAELERELAQEPELEKRQVVLHTKPNELRQKYALSDELGRGKFGTVFRCVELSSGREFAAKFVGLRRHEDRTDVLREIEIMSQLQHKRLLQLYDAYDDQVNGEMCLVTELIEGGELFERIVDDDFELTERKAAIFMRQICEGVNYMHSLAIVHLDLKPENILCISKNGCRIKLIDFGLARQLLVGEPLRVMFGTPDFAAPEVLAYELVSLETDMWSVGVICYVLLSGLSPFMGDTDLETMANVARATYDFDDRAFDPISSEAKNFIQSLLLRQPEKRLGALECLSHPWLAPRENLLTRKHKQTSEMLPDIHAQRRRQSMGVVVSGIGERHLYAAEPAPNNCETCARPQVNSERSYTLPLMVSLDKGNLKKYVVRRKWHKTVHAILALNRMGANLKLRLDSCKLEV